MEYCIPHGYLLNGDNFWTVLSLSIENVILFISFKWPKLASWPNLEDSKMMRYLPLNTLIMPI
jgi:hypothetical protein